MSRTSRRMVGVGITLVATVGLAVGASGVTSAYFSDTKSGTISGTVGYVKINVGGGNGGDGLDFAFDNLRPGEPQSIKIDYKSTGTGTQDLWLAFPNRSALHALNNLGTYGTVTVSDSSSGVVFTSVNLNDGRTVAPNGADSCGGFSATPPACWPLPTQLKVRSNLAPGAEGTITFTFGYASKLGGNGPAVWNQYPSYPQAYGLDAADSGNGLPYNVVATQPGQTP
ncbi:MAG TPA: hypothetical protein VFL59_01260 [Candidatus Nanopelagicales bacterium]|nr:hypothetical protein [Candidatus Nanopelagicales bacterium]